MITNTDGYIHLIEYLTEHLSLFEKSTQVSSNSPTIIEIIEQELSKQIIDVCRQNDELSAEQRSDIIHEIDLIVDDLAEILTSVHDNPASNEQTSFIKEFSLLIKNLLDTEIHTNLLS